MGKLQKTLKKYILITMLFSLVVLPIEAVMADETVKVTEKSTEEISTTAKEQIKKAEKELPDRVKTVTKGKIVITKITLESRSAVKIEWGLNAAAKGYIVYRSTDGKNYSKIKKISNGRCSSFTDKKLEYGKEYIYAVRAFVKYNGKNYYSVSDKKGTTKKLKVKKKYTKAYTFLYDMDNNRIENVQAFLKKKDYCLKVNLTQNVMTIYARDGKKGYRIPVKAYLCSGNTSDKTGTFSLGVKYRYRTLFYNSYSQWASRIYGAILFHTVPYKRSQNPNSLDAKQYNLLGTSASHGCIRLQCVATRWINKNCKSGTRVVMYKSKNPGALGKPKLEKIPKWHTWDPTDPTMKYKCKEHGCNHQKV